MGPKAEVAHAALGPRCREGLRGGKGFRAQRHLPGERNRQTIYRPLRGGFTEPQRPLGRGARSQQGGEGRGAAPTRLIAEDGVRGTTSPAGACGK